MKKNITKKSVTKNLTKKFNTSTGSLPYNLRNDYMFRAVFQSRPKALEGLCRSVLRLAENDLVRVELRNPIELGARIESKEFILDLAVNVNNSVFLNLEMQMYHDDFWAERSLSYACRSYDNLNHGESYDKVLPVVHVGFLSYDLFPKYPEFVATYQIANVKNHQIYSDKLKLCVVYLNRVELATEEDKGNDIDLWAKMFNATTWREINMLAQKNEYLKETVSGVRKLTEDEKIRQQCQAREDFEYWERIKRNHYQQELWVREEALRKKEEALQEKDEALQQKDEALQQEKIRNQQKEEVLQQKEAQLAAALARIAELEAFGKQQ